MKRASTYGVLASIFLVAILFTSANAISDGYDIPNISSYTYDSDIDPKEVIEKWDEVLMDPYKQYLLIAYRNPDTTGEISSAVILSKLPGICVAFAYYKNYEAHLFIYDRNASHYTREHGQKAQELIELMKKIFQSMLGHTNI